MLTAWPLVQVYGVHGVITGSLPAQCDFKFEPLLQRPHTLVALTVSRELLDSSLIQLKKCYYFTFLLQAGFLVSTSAVDVHSFFADPDPAAFLMRIRVQL